MNDVIWRVRFKSSKCDLLELKSFDFKYRWQAKLFMRLGHLDDDYELKKVVLQRGMPKWI